MDNLGTFMNIMTDFGFKHVFGNEQYKSVIIRFLNVMFAQENILVNDVIFHNKEVLPPNTDGKRIIYDVYCTTPKQQEHFILEMQQVHHAHLEKRMLYYLAKGLASQGIKGDEYDYNSVFCIFFVNFQFAHLKKRMIHDFTMSEKTTKEQFSDLMRLIIIALSQAKSCWRDCTNDLEKTIFLIKNMHNMDKNSEAYKSGEYNDMFEAASIDNLVAEDAVAYSQSERAYQDLELYRQSGFEEGEAKGIKIGMEKGKIEDARKLRDMGKDADFIQKVTGLLPHHYS